MGYRMEAQYTGSFVDQGEPNSARRYVDIASTPFHVEIGSAGHGYRRGDHPDPLCHAVEQLADHLVCNGLVSRVQRFGSGQRQE